MIRTTLGALACLLGLSNATAAEQAAHVHGIAALNVAVEDTLLEMEFVSPAGNIVGFEHEPSTEAERRAVHQALEQLKKGTKLFSLPADTGCRQLVADVGFGPETEGDDEHDAEQAHTEGEKHGSHNHGAAHDDHDEHAEGETHSEHDHAKEEDSTAHAELHAYYRFQCNGSAIETIGVRFFEHWPGIKTIRIQVLTPTRQFGGVLKADAAVIKLK